jgi:alanine-glyoxylate transaminase / serine-glyoxylate transaminase / serine-pyruvate transaminase
MYGLIESMKMIQEEGLDNVFARHHFLAEGVRAAVTQGWQLKLCAAEAKWHSDTVTAVMLPPGIAGTEVIARAYRRYNLSLGRRLVQSGWQAVSHRPLGRYERSAFDGRDQRC